jgi:hypothetical protein
MSLATMLGATVTEIANILFSKVYQKPHCSKLMMTVNNIIDIYTCRQAVISDCFCTNHQCQLVHHLLLCCMTENIEHWRIQPFLIVLVLRDGVYLVEGLVQLLDVIHPRGTCPPPWESYFCVIDWNIMSLATMLGATVMEMANILCSKLYQKPHCSKLMMTVNNIIDIYTCRQAVISDCFCTNHQCQLVHHLLLCCMTGKHWALKNPAISHCIGTKRWCLTGRGGLCSCWMSSIRRGACPPTMRILILCNWLKHNVSCH